MDSAGKARAAEYVQNAMRRAKVTEPRLVEMTGVDRQTIHAFLGGDRWPRPDTRTRIEEVLGLEDGAIEQAAHGFIEDDALAELPEGVTPVGDPEDNLFKITMVGVFGVNEIIVSGAPADADVLREQAAKLIATIRRDAGESRANPA